MGGCKDQFIATCGGGFLRKQGKGDDCVRWRADFIEQFCFKIVRDRHFAGGDLLGRGADEAELAMPQALGAVLACCAHRRAEDAAGHRSPRVHIAAAGCGVKRGACGIVGEVFEACLIFDRIAERARVSISGKKWTVFRKPGSGAALDFSRERWICGAQFSHSGTEARGVKRVDGKGSVAALRATNAACKERSGAAR